jgi:hypothetical protein
MCEMKRTWTALVQSKITVRGEVQKRSGCRTSDGGRHPRCWKRRRPKSSMPDRTLGSHGTSPAAFETHTSCGDEELTSERLGCRRNRKEQGPTLRAASSDAHVSFSFTNAIAAAAAEHARARRARARAPALAAYLDRGWPRVPRDVHRHRRPAQRPPGPRARVSARRARARARVPWRADGRTDHGSMETCAEDRSRRQDEGRRVHMTMPEFSSEVCHHDCALPLLP